MLLWDGNGWKVCDHSSPTIEPDAFVGRERLEGLRPFQPYNPIRKQFWAGASGGESLGGPQDILHHEGIADFAPRMEAHA